MEVIKIKPIVKYVKTKTADWKNEFISLYPEPLLIEKALEYPHAHFAAFNKEELVGHSLIQYIDGKWIFGALVVKAEFREQGIGKALTKIRIDYAEKHGITKLWYTPKNDNLVSICCHVGLGFEKTCASLSKTKHIFGDTNWYYLEIATYLAPELN